MRELITLLLILILSSCLKKNFINLNTKQDLIGIWKTSCFLDLDCDTIFKDNLEYRTYNFTEDSFTINGKIYNTPFIIHKDSLTYNYSGSWELTKRKYLQLLFNNFQRLNSNHEVVYLFDIGDSIVSSNTNDDYSIILSSEYSSEVSYEILNWSNDEIWIQVIHELDELGHIEVISRY